MIPRVLIVDGDPQYCRWLSLHLEAAWPDATPDCCDLAGLDARLAALPDSGYDIILLCLSFAENAESQCEGLLWLRRVRRPARKMITIAVADGGNEKTAVKALRLGAADYLPRKSLDPATLMRAIRRALKRSHSGKRATPAPAESQPAAAPTAFRRPPNSPPSIPNYHFLHQLGESSRAMVWLAQSDTLGRLVAVKISKEGNDESTDEYGNFGREHAALTALQHPGVVSIHEYGMHNGQEFLTMDYFPCGDLRRRLQMPISTSQCLDYLRRIAEALLPVHEASLMHRDLKPANIMLREDCSVVLIDFGLAKRQNGTSNTAIGVRRGSPYYMSPEQAHGMPLDSRSDIYSLGVIFYEMLTGSRPYMGSTAIEIMDKHVRGERPSLGMGLEDHEALLAAMMAANREERVANAGELLQLFDDCHASANDIQILEHVRAS